MKFAIVSVLILVSGIIAFGSPLAGEGVIKAHHFGSPEPILPMAFAHADHTTVGCIDCHHNYVDDTGSEACMHCHVVNQEVWPLLEQQFHELCRDCHAERSAAREDGGPARRCAGCHHVESDP